MSEELEEGCTFSEINGIKEWRNKNGILHRLNGPAIEYSNGTKVWYQNGECHRNDGPAIELKDGNKSYWLNGLPITSSSKIAEIESLNIKYEPISTVENQNCIIKNCIIKNCTIDNMEPGIPYDKGVKLENEIKIPNEFSSAALRVGAEQFVNIIAKSFEMKVNISNKELFKNQYSKSFISLISGLAIGNFSKFENNATIQLFAEELRINGMAMLGGSILNSLISEVVEILAEEVEDAGEFSDAAETIRIQQ